MHHHKVLIPSDILLQSMNLHDISIMAFGIVLDIILGAVFAYIHISYCVQLGEATGKPYSIWRMIRYFTICMFAFMWLRLIGFIFAFSSMYMFIFVSSAPIVIVLILFLFYRLIVDIFGWYNFNHPSNEPL